jgi:hypothetical protein
MRGITLSAYRGDDGEADRIVRLARVYATAITGLSDQDERREFAESLHRLHDHKGELTAVWCCEPCYRQWSPLVDQAWSEEAECNIRHISERERCIVGASEYMDRDADDVGEFLPAAILVLPAQGTA